MYKGKISSTREDIIMILKTKAPLPVSDIANQLGITEMAVRRHLNMLERDQLIKTELVRQPMGRPASMYSLTEKAHERFPKNYSDFSIGFLKDIEELDGIEKVEQLFRMRETRLEENYKDQMENLPLEEKIQLLAEFQNKKGYMVHLEKKEEGNYFLKQYNCPISQVAKEYNKACSCELSLFQKLLQTPYIVCNQTIANGEEYCEYIIKENSRS